MENDPAFNKSFRSLFDSENLYMIKYFLTNNLISIQYLISNIKTYFDNPDQDDHWNCKSSNFYLDLADLAININNYDINETFFQSILPMIIQFRRNNKINKKHTLRCDSIINNLIERGAFKSLSLSDICSLKNNLFIEYISTNDSIINNELEIECAKKGSCSKLKCIQDILKSSNIHITNPLILLYESRNSLKKKIKIYCIEQALSTNDKYLFNRIALISLSSFFTEHILDQLPDNYVPDECTSLLFVINYNKFNRTSFSDSLNPKFLNPNIIKYKDIDFSKYFSLDDVPSLPKGSLEYFLTSQFQQNVNRCPDTKINFIYDDIMKNHIIKIITDDAIYEDIMEKGSILLDFLMSDSTIN
jgi:hypothetical protein